MTHEPSGLECCVGHMTGDWQPLPACQVCKHCGQFIRPERMGEECPAASQCCTDTKYTREKA